MSFIKSVKVFLQKYFFNPKWTCNICETEIFDEGYFCEKCAKKLPFNNKCICEHCGRRVKQTTEYCTTCKGRLVFLDKCRSVFVYEDPVSKLVLKAKYNNGIYLLNAFAEYMEHVYYENYFCADGLCFVPMTKKRLKYRGYNQSKILAELLSEKINVPVLDCIIKTKDTQRQAKLNKKERMKNLEGSFKIADKKLVRNKSLLIIDDVTTTGATAECIASALKKSGAKQVFLLTVASVPSKDGY